MKKRTYDTPVYLLIQTATYRRIKSIAEERHISMSSIIREGIRLRIAQIDKEPQKA